VSSCVHLVMSTLTNNLGNFVMSILIENKKVLVDVTCLF
jgi:hypothetical protein